MTSKKYTQDYSVEYEKLPGGKMKSRTVYTGKDFVFAAPKEKIRGTAELFTFYIAAAWCALLIPLFMQSGASRTWYIIIPHACTFMPLFNISAMTFRLWTAKQPLTRKESEIFSLRAPNSSIFFLVLSGIATSGILIRLFLKPAFFVIPGDLVFILCELFLLSVSCLLFRSRNRTATVEAGDKM